MQDRLGLSRMGTTFDFYLHNDLERADFPPHKLYIFSDTIYLPRKPNGPRAEGISTQPAERRFGYSLRA